MLPNPNKGVKLYIDVDFVGKWTEESSANPRLFFCGQGMC